MNISCTQIITYSTCSLKYKFRYITRIPPKPKAHLKLPNVLHQTINLFHRQNGDKSLQMLSDLYAQLWGELKEEDKASYDEGLGILGRFYWNNKEDLDRIVSTEEDFWVPINGFFLRGRYDRVDKLGEGRYEIIDYKTARGILTQEEADQNLQLGVYALAFRMINNIIPEKLSFYYLRTNQKVSTTRTEEDLEKLTNKIEETIKGICYERFGPKEGKGCLICDYRRYCPAKSDKPIEYEKDGELQLVFDWERKIPTVERQNSSRGVSGEVKERQLAMF